jgi:DNA-binding GntR family transcriptional regulator
MTGAEPVAKNGSKNPGTRTQQLFDTLEGEILLGTLSPGSRLDEHELAERFGVSRTPVREALRLLAASGLVDIRSNQGASVSRIGLDRLLKMFEVLAELEALCARLATRRITAGHLLEIIGIHARMAQAAEKQQTQSFYDLNREFHEAIYAAAQNEYLAEQIIALRKRTEPYRRRASYLPGRVATTTLEHKAILDAISANQPDLAYSLMRNHIMPLGPAFSDFVAALG